LPLPLRYEQHAEILGRARMPCNVIINPDWQEKNVSACGRAGRHAAGSMWWRVESRQSAC
jgi:hypothetical protein